MHTDEYFRSLCDNPADYDKVIAFIRDHNKHAMTLSCESKEDFAIECVHACIRTVIFGKEQPNFCSTGGCIAIRFNSKDKDSPNYRKVVLATQLFDIKG